VSGKVDRRALPPPEANARPAATGTQPTTDTERILAVEIVAPLLGLERVGVDENFFTLGGHSLQAAQLMSQIRRRFGADVGLAGFFRTPTVANLAALIDRGRAAALDDDAMLALVEGMSATETAKLLAGRGR
jgi:aryl carrier-like protein